MTIKQHKQFCQYITSVLYERNIQTNQLFEYIDLPFSITKLLHNKEDENKKKYPEGDNPNKPNLLI